MPPIFVVLLALTTLIFAGCSAPEAPSPAGPATSSLSPGWNELTPGGETICSDGSEYRFFARPGDPEKLLVYLQGGGGCWSRETCDEDISPSYNIRIGDFHPSAYNGIFDFDNPDYR